MKTSIDLDSAKVVPVGPHTNHTGNYEEIWTPGYGVELKARIGIYEAVVIVPFLNLEETERLFKDIQGDK